MKAAELDSIKTLLATGANIDGVGERASPLISLRTPLWIAVSEAGATMSQHLKNLVEAAQNCDPTLPPRDLAKERELAVSVVKLLLESGANVENPCWGTTPLWQATHWNDPEVAELLLSAGADPNAESVSPLSKLATKKGRTTIPGYFNTVVSMTLCKMAQRQSLKCFWTPVPYH